MDRKLIIDGNAVYELDEKCMLKKREKGNAVQEENAAGYSNRVREEKDRME